MCDSRTVRFEDESRKTQLSERNCKQKSSVWEADSDVQQSRLQALWSEHLVVTTSNPCNVDAYLNYSSNVTLSW